MVTREFIKRGYKVLVLDYLSYGHIGVVAGGEVDFIRGSRESDRWINNVKKYTVEWDESITGQAVAEDFLMLRLFGK